MSGHHRPLRIATWNVRSAEFDGRYPPDSPYRWSRRIDDIAYALEEQRPHFIALQEMSSVMVNELLRLLPKYGVSTMPLLPALCASPEAEVGVILHRLDSDIRQLSGERGIVRLPGTPAKGHPYGMFWVTYEVPWFAGRKPIVVSSAHYPNAAKELVDQSLVRETDHLAAVSLFEVDIFACGDRNLYHHPGQRHWISKFERLTDLHAGNPHPSAHIGSASSWIGFPEDPARLDPRSDALPIDHVFSNRRSISSAHLPIVGSRTGTLASDHKLVIVDFR